MKGGGSLNYFSFIGYVVIVFTGTGLLLLLTDAKAYKNTGLKKEGKIAKILGWTNLTLGVMLFAANLLYEQWSW